MSSPFCYVIYSLYSDLLKLVLALYQGHCIPNLDSAILPVVAGSVFPQHLAEDLPSLSNPPQKTHSGKACQKFWVAYDVFYFWDIFLDL